MGKRIRIGKGFIAAGFVAVTGGDAAIALGSALLAFLYRPETALSGSGSPRVPTTCPALPMLRVRVGSRVTVLERRAHGTPTGRCSRGHWERIDVADTPRNAGEWGKLGRFWAWRIVESVETLGPRAPWNWADDKGKNRNLCGTPATSNIHHPTIAGGQGKGRVGRGSPSMGDAWGFSPASGRRAGTHDAHRVSARVANQHRIDAAIRAEFQKEGR